MKNTCKGIKSIIILTSFSSYVVFPGSTGICPWSPSFLLYINDLHRAIWFCKVHYFADYTNFLFLTNSIKKLNKLITVYLKNLANWLNANKISLNVKKTATVIFKSKVEKYEGFIKLKINSQRLSY